MSILSTNVHASNGLVSFFETTVANIKAGIETRRKFRQTYNELAALSDRELADLGIARSMIQSISWEAARDAA